MPNPQVNPKDAALRFAFFSALNFTKPQNHVFFLIEMLQFFIGFYCFNCPIEDFLYKLKVKVNEVDLKD